MPAAKEYRVSGRRGFMEYEYKVTAAGRVNIIGEHIDYCGGKVLPAALKLCNTVYVRPNGTDKINLSWTTLPDKVSLSIDRLESYKSLEYGNYQAGSAYMWLKAGHKLIGCDMLQDCTVPFGSGLSSSAAIEVSTIAALAAVAGEAIDKVEIALLAQKAEHEFAGVNCGIMDQYASACGKEECAMLLDCATLDCAYVPVKLGKYCFVIIDTRKPHNLIQSKYNERRSEADSALERIQKRFDVPSLASVTKEQLNKCSDLLPGALFKRARHIVSECERVDKSVIALERGDVSTLGELLNSSHYSLRDDYEVTGFEPDALTDAARANKYCIGSRMTGGGFGGSVISLVESEHVQQFIEEVKEEYFGKTGYNAVSYPAQIGNGITVTRL